jgi:hypothetical protein
VSEFLENADKKPLAYSLVKEEVVEAPGELYAHLRILKKSNKPVDYWKKIPQELKSEFAISFACILDRMNRKQKIPDIIKDFYDTVVEFQDAETKNWLSAIVK